MTNSRKTSRGPVLIDARARYRAAARWLRNTAIGDTCTTSRKIFRANYYLNQSDRFPDRNGRIFICSYSTDENP